MAELESDGGARGTVETRRADNGTAYVTLGGELDISNAGALQAAIDPIIDTKPETLVFELGKLSFMDSSGISVLLYAASHVDRVELREATAIIRRVLEATGVTEVLHLT
ncbi:MAG TPA: STAS domain-containing protein [Acidimicrobiia bacterium]|jgi:anti-sigma B factor antagonist|nr:STAS domain-containing protein [Acidimicrobiia bacterium]